MLNQLLPDLRRLLDLTRQMENFDATLAAASAAGKPIDPSQQAYDERSRMQQEAMHLRGKWSI